MKNITLTACALVFIILGFPAYGAADRPNVVIILADDLGYGDLGCYNADSNIPTPNLDRLATEGMRFTDAHSPSAVCSPTRYGLLTGRYAWRTEMKSRVLWAFDRPLIEPDRWTIARMMKGAGYHTACIGKWHLGWAWPTREGKPLDLPFKIGRPGPHAERVRLARIVDYSKPLGGGPLGAGFDFYFGDDVINQPPFLWIEDDRCLTLPTLPNHPKILHGSSNGPCTPDWDHAKVLPRMTERAIDYLRKRGSSKDQPFLLYFPLTAPHVPIVPPGRFSGKSVYGPYGDFVYYVDWIVGRIAATLEETGAAANTLLVFTSDNGSYAGNLKGHRPNGSLRGRKGQIFEGGHRVPLIIRWPGKVAANSRNDQLVGLNDLPATFAAILKNPIDDGTAEDSVNLMPTLRDPEKPVRNSLVHHSVLGEFALRSGKWKIIPSKKMLFDLEADLGERTNLAAKHPKIVAELKQLMGEITVAKADKKNASKPSGPKFQLDYKKKGLHDGLRQIKATLGKDSVIFDVTDQVGIGGGAINLVEGQWPKKVFIRLHLTGLEGFGVTVGDKTFLGSYHGENFPSGKNRLQTRMLDVKGNPLKGRYLLKFTDPNASKRIIGYYEAEVPQSALKSGAKKIDLSWVDFYRR